MSESIELKRMIITNKHTGAETELRVFGTDSVTTIIALDTISFTIEGLQRVQLAITDMLSDVNSLGYSTEPEPVE